MLGVCAFDASMAVIESLLWVLLFPPLKWGAGPMAIVLWLVGSLYIE